MDKELIKEKLKDDENLINVLLILLELKIFRKKALKLVLEDDTDIKGADIEYLSLNYDKKKEWIKTGFIPAFKDKEELRKTIFDFVTNYKVKLIKPLYESLKMSMGIFEDEKKK